MYSWFCTEPLPLLKIPSRTILRVSSVRSSVRVRSVIYLPFFHPGRKAVYDHCKWLWFVPPLRSLPCYS